MSDESEYSCSHAALQTLTNGPSKYGNVEHLELIVILLLSMENDYFQSFLAAVDLLDL